MTGRARWLTALPPVAALCALGALHVLAPRYLLHQGFPLDDAWIHAVYARELARSGVLAYNPGVPATGETAPLWALLLAMVYKAAGTADAAVVLTMTGEATDSAADLTTFAALRQFLDSQYGRTASIGKFDVYRRAR